MEFHIPPGRRQEKRRALHYMPCTATPFSGGRVAPCFNHSRAVFLPQGDVVQGGEEVREPHVVRPLSLSNTDKKLISSAIASVLNHVAAENCHIVQRGFAKGRMMNDNIINMDGLLTLWGT
eukprot:9251352-Pyramimonas_sp.AAC.1